MSKLVILGAGGYANTVKDVAEQLGHEIIAMLDDKTPEQPLSSFADYLGERDISFIPAFGNNEFRFTWIEKLTSSDVSLATLIHPSSYISPKSRIGEGVGILPHAIVNTGTTVSTGCIINLASIVDHDCILEPGVHIAPGAIVKGENRVRRGMKIESGTVVEARSMK